MHNVPSNLPNHMLSQSNFYDMSSKGDLITKHEANGLGLITSFDHHCIQ